ncbi:MAG: noncanonical pyrimidine nucleotidase, YjjG family [Candidatus Cloacimonetes bacterium 4572_65]|nr:MAG: noncanonical pyrimidine nucleotidase, YjjG family [Candidatus Cloacimonetes bacterium 4572_65]
MKYKHIIFDLDNTLLDYDLAEKSALEMLLNFYHIQGDFNDLRYKYKTINNSFWRRYEAGTITIEELKVQRHKEFMTQIGKRDVDPVDCAKQYTRFLSEHAYPLPGSYEVLDYLRDKGYNLLLASNGLPEVQYPRLKSSDMQEYFSYIGISQELGFQKPDIGFFTELFSKSDIESTEDVMIIGDSLNSDIKGGLNAGIATCWFNPKDKDSDIKPDFHIKELLELKNIL